MKMYAELAKWWPLLSAPEDYAEEVDFFLKAFREAGVPIQGTMVEFGSGGGNNALHFKPHFALTLTDISPEMLAMSRALNPECEHLVGDMRTVRLERQFDVVFIHDAIDYMTTEADLRRALETAYLHCKPGGAAMFVPDHMREEFKESSELDGDDGDGRALRYAEWSIDPDPNDSTYTTYYVFMLREGAAMHIEHEAHVCGLFPRATWLQLMQDVGFTAHDVIDPFDRHVFIAKKSATT